MGGTGGEGFLFYTFILQFSCGGRTFKHVNSLLAMRYHMLAFKTYALFHETQY